MARFRTVALGAALIAATAGAVSAQTTHPGHKDSAKAGEWRKGQVGERRGEMRPGARRGMERKMRGPGMDLLRGLDLTETQRTQVRAIHEKYQSQMKMMRDQNTESQTAALHEQMFREVRAVLTAEQRAKVDAQFAERIKRLDEQKARLERMRR